MGQNKPMFRNGFLPVSSGFSKKMASKQSLARDYAEGVDGKLLRKAG
jgi:hypothetical protein